ncbi:hypothetical protein LTR66_001388 [Elasticomyces elasticus]|nr:hypothetical protein LTR66_001388 [Elasticomyces elasticus]
MPSSFFKMPRASSQSMQDQLPYANNEVSAEDLPDNANPQPPATPPNRTSRSHSSASAPAPSSSHAKTPTRSYIQHIGHGSSVPVQYSSSGVREQTEALSSSFLEGSSPTRTSSFTSSSSFGGRAKPRSRGNATTQAQCPWEPEVIEEISEPASPEGVMAAHERDYLTSKLDAHGADSDANGSGVTTSARAPSANSESLSAMPDVAVEDADSEDIHERTPLLPQERLPRPKLQHDGAGDVEAQVSHNMGTLERVRVDRFSIKSLRYSARNLYSSFRTSASQSLNSSDMLRFFSAIFLGLLLTLLDALSYAASYRSLRTPPAAPSKEQSDLKWQATSAPSHDSQADPPQIEVVPFFHKMTYIIMARVDPGHHAAIRATTIVSYAMSSIITGAVFGSLGAAKLGSLVSFFPGSILQGCIGGVGIFLAVTGVEVSARLDGNLEFGSVHKLFEPDTLALWIPPLALAIILQVIKRYTKHDLVTPAYYCSIIIVFYIVVAAVPQLSIPDLRGKGWVFEAPETGVPFYHFYSYYKFGLVDWKAVWQTVPTQLALTFFGILHVPINIPALALSVGEDNVSVNRELILHGISNALSGLLGSIQNYLVYINSLLFIKSGGNSRLAGFLLAAATFGLLVSGPHIIGYVPVMVVGTLIYELGIELTASALWESRSKLNWLEYGTIVLIAVIMGVYDFVVGIGVGIALACLVYVVQTSQKGVIRYETDGATAESTVRRHTTQRHYLHKVGPQIRVIKLGGYLFFGSIVKVEKRARAIIEKEAFAAEPVHYVILDLSHVTGIDYSAANAFVRMHRILHRRRVDMVLAGVKLDDEIGQSLKRVELFVEEDGSPAPKVFEDLNGALESCENELLVTFTEKQRGHLDTQQKETRSDSIAIIPNAPLTPSAADQGFGSPVRALLHRAASATIREYDKTLPMPENNPKQPLTLLIQAFHDFTNKDATFWTPILPYFTRREYTRGTVLYSRGDRPDGFYLLQSGVLRADYNLEQGEYSESIMAGTTCGELPFFSETSRTSTVAAESDCVAWLLSPESWEALQQERAEISRELLKIGMKLSAERMKAVTS